MDRIEKLVILLLIIMSISVCYLEYSKKEITNIYINDNIAKLKYGEISSVVEVIYKDNKHYVPIREVSEIYKYKVEWNKKEKLIELNSGFKTVLLSPDKGYVVKNNKKEKIDFFKDPRGVVYIYIEDLKKIFSVKTHVEWEEK